MAPQQRALPPRAQRVSFRVSPDEYAALEAAAQAAGLTVSAFVRGALPTLVSEAGRLRKRPARRGEAVPLALPLARIARNLEALRQWVTGHEAGLSRMEVVEVVGHLVAVEGALAQLAEGPP